MKSSLILIIFLLTSSKCQEKKELSVDKAFHTYIMDNNFEKAFGLLDPNSSLNHHNSRDTAFNQFSVIQEYLEGKEIEYKCDSFIKGDFIGVTSTFIPFDSSIQFGLEVRFVFGENTIFAYNLTQNDRWFHKFLNTPSRKNDASKFVRPSLK